jgi:dimethylaniline monooxygenase (N-oxide forming)
METKRVVIVGAGVSGLAVCKHLLERGCRPVVFEADAVLGGVWARAPDCTQLQTPRPMYQYSDFPWPEDVTEMFPDHRQVAAYLDAYARHFGVLGCIRFGHRVVGMEYDGVKEEAVETWGEWSGNGQAFGSGDGEWRLSVADAEGHVEVSMQHACACARSLHRSCTYSATKEAGVCMCFNLLLLPSGASRL